MSNIIKSVKFKEVYGEFYSEGDAKSLVVIFPGLKYGHDKPLLYYARKAAQISGKDVLCLNYDKKLDWDDIGKEIIGVVADECYNIIGNSMKSNYKCIYFLSKSIGTEVCGRTAEKLGTSKVKFFYLTPTYTAVKYIEKFNGLVIAGTKDSIFENKYIEEVKKINGSKLMLIEGGNHSLEVTGEVIHNIDVLKAVVNKYIDFFEEE